MVASPYLCRKEESVAMRWEGEKLEVKARFYEGEVLPRLITILYFMIECLGVDRKEILKRADLGVQKEKLWISNVKAIEERTI